MALIFHPHKQDGSYFSSQLGWQEDRMWVSKTQPSSQRGKKNPWKRVKTGSSGTPQTETTPWPTSWGSRVASPMERTTLAVVSTSRTSSTSTSRHPHQYQHDLKTISSPRPAAWRWTARACPWWQAPWQTEAYVRSQGRGFLPMKLSRTCSASCTAVACTTTPASLHSRFSEM